MVSRNDTYEFTLVATTAQAGAEDYLGSVIVGLDPAVAADIAGTPGRVDALAVVLTADASSDSFVLAASGVLPAGVEAVASSVVVDEQLSVLNRFLDPFSTVLVGFSFVALFIAAFIVTNTFNISVSQRLRELAMLRAVGAGPTQVALLVSIESLLVGVLSSGVGIMLGLLVARGIVGLLSAAGGFPSVELVTSASTVMFAVVLGVGVTFLASLRPALRASRVAPVAAFSAAAATPRSRRPFLGFAGLLLGAAIFATSILLLPGAAPRLALGAVGAALFYASIPALAAVLIGPISRAVVLLRPSSVVASLAAANASRTPRRTSAAASAMIVGLSLVSAVTVVAASVSSTLTTALADHIAGSHVARSEQQGPGGVPREYVADLQETKAFASVVGVRPATVGIGGTGRGVSSVDPEGFTSVFDLEVVQGTMDVSSPFSVALEQSLAESLSLRSGMSVEVTHLNGQAVMWEVVGVFKDPGLLLADVVVSKETMDVEGVPTQNDRYVVAGGPALDIEARLSEFSLVYPQVTLEDLATFQESRSAQIDRLLGVVNALLGLTVLVAAIGIANTLSLTVLERAREIGLLRAVGASRRQVKRMVRLESLLIGVLGGVLGVTVGVGFGILLTRAFPEALAGSVTVPAGRLLVLFVAGALTALGASWWPARRAAASDVVAAVTTD
jgi:putative ABC transport system permease protein